MNVSRLPQSLNDPRCLVGEGHLAGLAVFRRLDDGNAGGWVNVCPTQREKFASAHSGFNRKDDQRPYPPGASRLCGSQQASLFSGIETTLALIPDCRATNKRDGVSGQGGYAFGLVEGGAASCQISEVYHKKNGPTGAVLR